MISGAIRISGILLLCSLTWNAWGADITGTITLKGEPPREKVLPLDAMCRKTRPGEVPTTRFFLADKSGGLADVFVYLKSVPGEFEPPATPVVIDQVGCEYVPYVLGAQKGQKIVVKNSDPILHNVHPTPRVKGNPEMNLAQLPAPIGKDLTFVFDYPEMFLRFKCDVHRWMYAYVSVMDHPFFTVSGKDGSYTIKNVPPGDYEIVAVHRKAHAPRHVGLTEKVTVKDSTETVDFTIDITKAD